MLNLIRYSIGKGIEIVVMSIETFVVPVRAAMRGQGIEIIVMSIKTFVVPVRAAMYGQGIEICSDSLLFLSCLLMVAIP